MVPLTAPPLLFTPLLTKDSGAIELELVVAVVAVVLGALGLAAERKLLKLLKYWLFDEDDDGDIEGRG